MTIRRSPSPLRKNFTILPNEAMNDPRLSWEARGMLAYLLSKPDDWKVIPKALINETKAGKDTVYRVLKELEDAGYMTQEQRHRKDGTFGSVERVVHEISISPNDLTASGFTASGLTASGSTASGKPAYIQRTDSYKELNTPRTESISISSTPNGASDAPKKGSEYTDDFEYVWSVYPRRVNKKEAYAAYNARISNGDGTVDELRLATENYALSRKGEEVRFTLHPKTFFGPNQRWRDYLPGSSEIKAAEAAKQPKGLSAIQEFLHRER